ncbi:type II toxin-antitoxin system RelE/ParE family toxin [Candidatus Woesearchaeota archaeon]|jgi:mRNA interferase RelE/StbE|nr:type II toxin-antitoxin system RelE/ParE family toxin [Candidatus Woesearchaeota archaeon]MBT5739649.1 type II toxin-antitoxin system RelE/ParE family toxin [Candidatus Woesearchaeota archaeon]
MFEVHLSQRANKFLNKLDQHISNRIKEKLSSLKNNPIPKDAKFIRRENNDKVFRYRIGDFRALYKVKDVEKIVLIAKIDKRSRVYH